MNQLAQQAAILREMSFSTAAHSRERRQYHSAAELSNLCHVGNAFKLLTSRDLELRDMVPQALPEMVFKRLRRPLVQLEVENYLSGSKQNGLRMPTQLLQIAWMEARKASRRQDDLWEMYLDGIRIACGDHTLIPTHRRKVICTFPAI